MVRRSAEPLVWLAFSAGGVAAALLIPALLFTFGVAIPLGLFAAPDHAHLVAVMGHPLTRLVLFGLCALALAHFAHRFRYTLIDGLRLRRFGRAVAALCYGAAMAGVIVAAYVLFFAL